MLLVGTGNRHKLDEIRAILGALPVAVVGIDVLPTGSSDVEETGTTFRENARIKALEFARRAATLPAPERPRWIVADDSGLCVDALDGAPGVYSARWAGESCTFADNNRKLLAELDGVGDDRRGAHFECTIACADVPARPVDEPTILFESVGTCSGRIAQTLSGTDGFGYDPLFIDLGSGRTFAELSADEKNAISHRGRALEDFRTRFLALIEGQARKPPPSPPTDV